MAQADMGGLLRRAMEMQKELKKVEEQLRNRYVEASTGGREVVVTFNGRQELMKVVIDPSVVDPKDVSAVEDLVLVAVNQGLEKSRKLKEKELAKVGGGASRGLAGLL